MDSREKIVATPIGDKKSKKQESSASPTHEELKFHCDPDRRQYYYEADDLESDEDSKSIASPSQIKEENVQPSFEDCSEYDAPALKYPEKFRLSQAFLDKINSKKPKPVYYDEGRGLYYVIDDDDEDLIPYEEAVVGETKSGVDNEVVVFADHVKPSMEDISAKNKVEVTPKYDEFRGLYYINAAELKSKATNVSASPSSKGLFSDALTKKHENAADTQQVNLRK